MQKVIISCDFANENEFNDFIKHFKNEKPFLKIGYQLFYATGRHFIERLKNERYPIFLDLKLHDIPNTVAQGIKSLASLNVDFITIHATGGIKMMEAAIKSAQGTRTKLLAVTQLTSISQEALTNELLIDKKLEDVVYRYALHALEAGMHGVICSAQEALYIKTKIANQLITVCPGIRMHDLHDDQVRIVTPEQAAKNHADYIVVGRPITKATNPLNEYLKYKKAFQGE